MLSRLSTFGTTIIVSLYTVIFVSVLVTDQLPSIPQDGRPSDLNLTQAWKDLHIIATRPHPYNSHANELVHGFLLSRLNPLASAYPHVHLVDDRVSNGSWEQTYFEGTNILVKVDGTDPSAGGAVLFSAHYDSVSTSTGTTDDGVGIVTLLQFVAQLAKTRSMRTAIFNFNNGEEDGLNGAHAFLQHPWSNLTTAFLNLEGASSGGRPVLFRGTSSTPLRAFHHQHVPHPHGNILAADAFARRVIRSRTDFTVYSEGGGMQGLDFAFYKGRSMYHTKYDAIPFLRGGIRALWSMMEAVNGAGRALLDEEKEIPSGDVVYFDLFGQKMVTFSLKAMQAFNTVFLAGVPSIVLIILGCQLAATRDTFVGLLWDGLINQDSYWVRFWVSVLFTAAAQAGLVWSYSMLNEFIVYSSPYLVLASDISLAYITLFIPLSFNLPLLRQAKVQSSNLDTLLLQLLIFTSLILLGTTFVLPIGGAYFFSVLAGCVFLGWGIGAANLVPVDNNERNGKSEDQLPEPTETTPLVKKQKLAQVLGTAAEDTGKGMKLWFAQLLIVVPVPVVLVSHIAILLVGAMTQSIVDGGPVWLVYAAFSLISTLLVLPLTPFMASCPVPKASGTTALQGSASRDLFRCLLFAFLFITAYTSGFLGFVLTPSSPKATRLGFPFSIKAPMKVFFQQRVEVIAPWVVSGESNLIGYDLDNATEGIWVQPRTYLTGVPYYLEQMIVPALPSAAENGADCSMDGDRPGLSKCSWPSGDDMIPFPGEGGHPLEEKKETKANTKVLSKNPWLSSSITRLSSTALRISIRGMNTRACRVYFDNARVKKWGVVGGALGVQRGYEIQEEGLGELRVWSRTWDREFDLEVELLEATRGNVKGSVACGWSEYESGMVGLTSQGFRGSTVPAFEEVLRFFPEWATLTKHTDGLVEVWSAFEI